MAHSFRVSKVPYFLNLTASYLQCSAVNRPLSNFHELTMGLSEMFLRKRNHVIFFNSVLRDCSRFTNICIQGMVLTKMAGSDGSWVSRHVPDNAA